jgi:hypothetical protein
MVFALQRAEHWNRTSTQPHVRARRKQLPPPWRNGPLTLYHGTVLKHWREIGRDGVRVDRGRTGTDFGPGFYTTADLVQAGHWAAALGRSMNEPAVVISADVDRDLLASLDTLYFVRGNEGADDFWSFVRHCRGGARSHARGGKQLYDVVVGPVSRNYKRRLAYEHMDQISFHTPEALAVLNLVTWSGDDPTR